MWLMAQLVHTTPAAATLPAAQSTQAVKGLAEVFPAAQLVQAPPLIDIWLASQLAQAPPLAEVLPAAQLSQSVKGLLEL